MQVESIFWTSEKKNWLKNELKYFNSILSNDKSTKTNQKSFFGPCFIKAKKKIFFLYPYFIFSKRRTPIYASIQAKYSCNSIYGINATHAIYFVE